MGIPGVQSGQSRLGRYELLARLATGGMGEIFLARLEGAAGFEKLYVVKRILPHLADDTRFRQMLIAEARIASKLSHSNICQVYELGETDGQLYIVMEYLEGVTLLPMLRRTSKQGHALDLGFVAGVIQQTCDALHYAHELKDRGEYLGIVHRDVTPSNIFLTESGVVKVLDFGIAKAKGASTQTQEGTVKGKYAYMAPEQLRGGDIDRRVDVFALGIVLFEMLAQRRLFQRKTDYLTFRAVMEQPIPDIRRYRPDASEQLAAVVAHALDREPATRFESARQVGTAVLDACGKRPWSQGEISDYVRANFADELGKRSHEVQSAVNRTMPGQPATSRATMPLIAHDDSAPPEDDDDEFPSVETDVDLPQPQFRPAPTPRAASEPGDFYSGTPPPFAGETTGSAPSLQPLRGSSPIPGGTVVVEKRSIVWPLVAVGMLAIAGGALFLVWRQTQQQQPPPTIVVNEERGSSAQSPPVQPPPGPTQPTPPANPPGPTPTVTPPSRPPAHPIHTDPYTAAVQAHLGALNRCLNEHTDTIPAGASATILIGTDGHPKTVTMSPAALGATALGACLHDNLTQVAFPSAKDDKTITVPFTRS
ncbi:MAG TPA: serine/threonine-protein kinase [Kofleriaceae bacterium]|nr:serine/threonine-protein kinase [Kofleriaceae bacterium]